MIEPLVVLLSLFFSLAGGALGISGLVELVSRALGQPEPQDPYSLRLRRLIDDLGKASAEMDSLLVELTKVAKDREDSLSAAEARLLEIVEEERQGQKRVEALQKTPVPAAEYFAQLTAEGEERSAKRDYLLFAAGVVVSTLVTILISWLGIG